uniref:Sodium-coupled monocarboxylate transporter 2 n=1 Tax=Denticeps clupeoides TaxID=299321 RepID=A0AAY4CNB9_9TELE
MDATISPTFQVWDYAVFACLFVVSSAIGVFFAVKGRKQVSSKEFLVGGRQMTFGPVALSLTASFMSAVTVLGAPSEVYRFGASFILFGIAYSFVVIFTAQLFVPVFYRSGITSTYEYLELRFCKVVRVAATLIYIVQTILYTGVVVFAPALALNQVTGFDLWGSIYATGIVCTFYCTLGGLKAVVWSDAFQMVVMLVGFMTVLVQGSWSTGGVNNVWHTSQAGQRLEVFDFDPSPLRRHTFWTITVGGTFTWLGIYGVNQSTIQRCISCKSETHARLALYFNLLGLLVILLCSVFSGLIMYTFYAACDPWTAQYIKAPDQLMPYFVMEILGEYPGLPGLFVACAFTTSGILKNNNMHFVVYFACTSMAIAASHMGGIVQAALSIHGMCGGPMLGLFSLGILFPCANSKGAAGGLILGIALSFWVGIGAFLYPASSNSTHPLGLSTEGCFLANSIISLSELTEFVSHRLVEADSWYSISYLYYSAVGFLGTLVAGLVITCLTGCTPPEDIKPGLIQPVCDIFCFCSDKMKRECWCGVDHEEEKLELENPDFMLAEGRRCSQEISPSTMEKRQSIALQDKAYSNAGFVSDSQAF